MFWEITQLEEIIKGAAKVLSSKSSFTERFHLSVQEIVAFLSDIAIPIEIDQRMKWHLTRCRDCVDIARFIAAIKCLIFEWHDEKYFYVRVSAELMERGFNRQGICIKPADDYQSVIWDYLSEYGEVITKRTRITKGSHITVKPPED